MKRFRREAWAKAREDSGRRQRFPKSRSRTWSRVSPWWAATSATTPASVPTRRASMVGDGEIVLGLGAGSQPNVASRLAKHVVSERRESSGEIPPRDVPRQPHTARS